MPHYLLVTLPEENFPKGVSHAHEHVVHALHGHARAIEKEPQFVDAFPVFQAKGQKHNPDLMALHTLKEGEVIHLVAPEGYTLVVHQYHSVAGTEHHTEVSIQKIEDFMAENGGIDPRPGGLLPKDVHPDVTASWPQHEKQ